MATKAKKRAGKKKTRKPAAKRSASVKRSRPRKSVAKRSAGRSVAKKSVARVKRVTRQVVQQATHAVTSGVEALRGIGENLVDRVRES